jgi:RNA polymerase sigma-70 factor (ECF subfamily)
VPGSVSESAARRDEAQRVRTLVDAAKEGDRDALEELYLIHFDRIYGYLHVTVGNRQDAEDLTTQTFLKMLESIRRFRWGSAPFSAWLFRIAHNLAMDHFRVARRWQPEEEVPEPEPDESTSAEAGALEAIGTKSMLELIDDLSMEQQQVLTLKFVFGFSNREAATVLGKTEGAVKSLQHRALVTLHDKLAKREAVSNPD